VPILIGTAVVVLLVLAGIRDRPGDPVAISGVVPGRHRP
jgi:hypothetical protein